MSWRLVPGSGIHFLVQAEAGRGKCSQKLNPSWLHRSGEEERSCLKGKLHPTPDFCYRENQKGLEILLAGCRVRVWDEA